jgi:threonine aldolase
MNFASDNTGPVHPNVLRALIEANDGYALPYGRDNLSEQVSQKV